MTQQINHLSLEQNLGWSKWWIMEIYKASNQIKFKTSMIRSNLWDDMMNKYMLRNNKYKHGSQRCKPRLKKQRRNI